MKRVFILAVLSIFTGITAFGQVRSIPSAVTESFKEKFPNAKMVTWKDNLVNFEADFTNDGFTYEVKFDSKGAWLETAKKIEFQALNDDVKDGFQKSKYNDWDVRGVKEITSKDNETLYRILVRKNDVQKKYLFFNKKGQLKKEALSI